jgi:hypothetical protein
MHFYENFGLQNANESVYREMRNILEQEILKKDEILRTKNSNFKIRKNNSNFVSLVLYSRI